MDYLGSGYKEKLVVYPVFGLRLLKKCLKKVALLVFRFLDHFSVTEFIVTLLRVQQHLDLIMSRSSLRRAIITNEFQMPTLVEVVANIVGVWPLVVSYTKKPAKKTDSDNLVV